MSPRRQKRQAGFTLIEVLLVLVILVVLGSIAVSTFTNTQRNAMKNAAKSQISMFKTPLAEYHLDMNVYPSTADGLEALRNAPASSDSRWGGPYMEDEIPKDPWGQPYQYASPGSKNPNSYDIWSYGPDQQNSTQDDIGNWSS